MGGKNQSDFLALNVISRAAKRGGFKRGGFPIWTCLFFLSFCVLFGTFPGFFPICSRMVQEFSRFVHFLFLGLLRAPTTNSPERVRDTIWTFPKKVGNPPVWKPPGLASLNYTPSILAIAECDGKSLAIGIRSAIFRGEKHSHCGLAGDRYVCDRAIFGAVRTSTHKKCPKDSEETKKNAQVRKLYTPCFLLFLPSPPSPSFLKPSPSWTLKVPPPPKGNATFRGWGAVKGLEGVATHEKKRSILKKCRAKVAQYNVASRLNDSHETPRKGTSKNQNVFLRLLAPSSRCTGMRRSLFSFLNCVI